MFVPQKGPMGNRAKPKPIERERAAVFAGVDQHTGFRLLRVAVAG